MYIYISKQLFDYYKVLRLVVGFGREIIYNNFVEVLSQTYSTGRFTSVFRGLFPSMCKNGMYRILLLSLHYKQKKNKK